MSFLAWIIVGLIAGILAKWAVPGEGRDQSLEHHRRVHRRSDSAADHAGGYTAIRHLTL